LSKVSNERTSLVVFIVFLSCGFFALYLVFHSTTALNKVKIPVSEILFGSLDDNLQAARVLAVAGGRVAELYDKKSKIKIKLFLSTLKSAEQTAKNMSGRKLFNIVRRWRLGDKSIVDKEGGGFLNEQIVKYANAQFDARRTSFKGVETFVMANGEEIETAYLNGPSGWHYSIGLVAGEKKTLLIFAIYPKGEILTEELRSIIIKLHPKL